MVDVVLTGQSSHRLGDQTITSDSYIVAVNLKWEMGIDEMWISYIMVNNCGTSSTTDKEKMTSQAYHGS